MENKKDKVIEWAVLLGGIVFMGLGLLSPSLLVIYGDPMSTWSYSSWEVWLASLCVGMYLVIARMLQIKWRNR
jgi:hypothetical protein